MFWQLRIQLYGYIIECKSHLTKPNQTNQGVFLEVNDILKGTIYVFLVPHTVRIWDLKILSHFEMFFSTFIFRPI